MSLSWGNQTLQIIDRLGYGTKLAIIRHSERPSFDNLPYSEWDIAELTTKGYDVAVEFGKILGIMSKVKNVQVFGWGLKRCQLTAMAISKGAEQAGCRVTGPSPISLKSPIADRVEYEGALHSGQWESFLTSWLENSNKNQTAMVPIDRYAKEIFGSLLRSGIISSDSITIIATHDLHILPLMAHAFSKPQRTLDYLDGIVIQPKWDTI